MDRTNPMLFSISLLRSFTLCDCLGCHLSVHCLQYSHYLSVQDLIAGTQLVELLPTCCLPKLLPNLRNALCLCLSLLVELL